MASWHFLVQVIPFTEDFFGGGVASGIVSRLLPQRVTLGVESQGEYPRFGQRAYGHVQKATGESYARTPHYEPDEQTEVHRSSNRNSDLPSRLIDTVPA